MKPPGDTDIDGSSSNCAAFFISTVHDLSLHETHALSSLPPHTRHSRSPLYVSCPAFISSSPNVTLYPFSSLICSIEQCIVHHFYFYFFYSLVSLILPSSLCLPMSDALNPHPLLFPFPSWFSLQCRCAPGQQWPGWETTEVTLRLGDGSRVVTDTQNHSEQPLTEYLQGQTEESGNREAKK